MEKKRQLFTLTNSELSFLESIAQKNNLRFISETVSTLISEFQKVMNERDLYREKCNELISELKHEKDRNSVMLQATTRNSSIALMMLDAIGIDVATTIEDYHDVKQESSLLQSARAVYQERLEAARTKKSNGD